MPRQLVANPREGQFYFMNYQRSVRKKILAYIKTSTSSTIWKNLTTWMSHKSFWCYTSTNFRKLYQNFIHTRNTKHPPFIVSQLALFIETCVGTFLTLKHHKRLINQNSCKTRLETKVVHKNGKKSFGIIHYTVTFWKQE